MYHEEKVINGKLMFRSSPNGKWYGYTYEALTKRVVEAEEKIKHLEAEVERLAQGDQ